MQIPPVTSRFLAIEGLISHPSNEERPFFDHSVLERGGARYRFRPLGLKFSRRFFFVENPVSEPKNSLWIAFFHNTKEIDTESSQSKNKTKQIDLPVRGRHGGGGHFVWWCCSTNPAGCSDFQMVDKVAPYGASSRATEKEKNEKKLER